MSQVIMLSALSRFYRFHEGVSLAPSVILAILPIASYLLEDGLPRLCGSIQRFMSYLLS